MHLGRIVILSAFATPLRSGAEACAEEVPSRLKDQFDFVIITARMRRDLPKHDRLPGRSTSHGGIPVVRLGFGCTFDKWLYPFLAPFEARKYKPQIVHAILETFAGLALYLCQWIVPKAKGMLTLQTTNRSFLKGVIVRSPDRVTAISSALVDIAKRLGREDVTKISNGIDLQTIRNATARTQKVPGRILFVGRLEKMKGVEILLRAFAKLDHPESHLRIVGDGSQRASLENLAQTLGVADRVTFVGFVSAPDVYDEYAQADVFCGLSLSEALGNVFLEAQAADCVVLAADVGGIRDIVPKASRIDPHSSIDSIADGLSECLTNESQRKSVRSLGRMHVQHYDWSAIAEHYARVYRELSS